MNTTRERLTALQNWMFETVCKGKSMKTPTEDDATTAHAEPRVFVGNYPRHAQQAEGEAEYSVAPSILIVPTLSNAMLVQEQRFDRYSGIHREPRMGGQLNVEMIFTVYEPGERNEYAQESGLASDIADEGDEGFYTMTDWMDELERALLGIRQLPDTDMFIWPASIASAPRMVQDSNADARPFYQGTMTLTLGHSVSETKNQALEDILNN